MKKHLDKICVICIIIALVVTVLFMNGESLGIEAIVDEDAEMYSSSIHFSSNDLKPDWDTSEATRISLDGESASFEGGGAYMYDGDVVIGQAGDYVVSGQLSDGSIIVAADSSAKIWILLDGADVYASDDAALRVDSADKVFLTLAEGKENRLASGEEYSDEALDGGSDGSIFTHDDLTINGTGSLSVEAAYKHGIAANDDLVLAGGKIDISAPQDAIHANDSIRVREAKLSLSAEDDGMTVAKDEGYFYMESGAVNISKCYEGIEAQTIEIAGGDIEIHSTDDGLNANGGSNQKGGPGGGQGEPTGMPQGTPLNDGTTEKSVAQNDSEKEDKDPDKEEDEETWIRITGGNLTIINEEGRDADGIDSNGNIEISGGTVRVSLTNGGTNNALDCGSESGGIIRIDGGDIVACGGSGMTEPVSDTSKQCSILYGSDEGFSANTLISLKDADGKELLSYEAPTSFSAVYLSSPEMKENETYTLSIGDVSEEIKTDSVAKTVGIEAGGGGPGGMGGHGGQNSGGQNLGGQNPGGQPQDAPGGQNPGGQDGRPPAMPKEGSREGQQGRGPGGGAFTAFSAAMEGGGRQGMPPEGHQGMTPPGDPDAAEDTSEDTRADIRELGKETYALLGATAAALAAGFVFVRLWI